MIPVRDEFVTEYHEAILKKDEEEFIKIFKNWKRSARKHLKILEIGKLFIELASDKVSADQQDPRFYLYTACRPYFITDGDYKNAPTIVSNFGNCEDAEEIVNAFRIQGRGLTQIDENEWDSIDPTEELDEHEVEWSSVLEELRTVRGMAKAIENEESYPVEMLKEIEIAGMEMLSQDEVEVVDVKGNDLAIQYGKILGRNFGRIAGLKEPTWWLGRNFWLGNLALNELGRFSAITKRSQVGLQKQIRSVVRNPVELFEPLARNGFGEAFTGSCESYGLGLYYEKNSLTTLIEMIERHLKTAIELGVSTTEHDADDVRRMLEVILESLIWANTEGCGLIEGDDLVGSYGER